MNTKRMAVEPENTTGLPPTHPPGYRLGCTDARGRGVFALRSYREKETVMVGQIEAEVARNHAHASQVAMDRFVLHGGLVSQVNHSCSPNCGIKVNDSGAHDFVAVREIPIGAELTFDYAMRNFTIDYFPSRCRCGAEACRGSITGWKDLPPEWKQACRDQAAPYLLEFDADSARALEGATTPDAIRQGRAPSSGRADSPTGSSDSAAP